MEVRLDREINPDRLHEEFVAQSQTFRGLIIRGTVLDVVGVDDLATIETVMDAHDPAVETQAETDRRLDYEIVAAADIVVAGSGDVEVVQDARLDRLEALMRCLLN